LRANWRTLHAALMVHFTDKSILARTVVALMDNLVDESTIYATLCCVLIGVLCTRPSWTIPPTNHIGVYCGGLLEQFHAGLNFENWGD
jgi:hypothetical protein